MNQISEEELKRLNEEGKEEIRKILNEGGKITDTIIREKDKVTTIRKIELENGETKSFKVTQTRDGIKIIPVDIAVNLDGEEVVKSLKRGDRKCHGQN